MPITICQNTSHVITSVLAGVYGGGCSQPVQRVYGFDTLGRTRGSFIKNCLPCLCNYGIIVVTNDAI
jgi:hypothetical protein